jgi:superfamily II DNA or RNA helicase
MDPYFTLVKCSHFFAILDPKPEVLGLILKFSLKYIHSTYVRENGRNVLKPNRVFGARIAGTQFRFHIGQYKHFTEYLENNSIYENYYKSIEKQLYEPVKIKTKISPKYESRPYQVEAINFLVNEEIGDNRSRLVGLRTGLGKTMVSLSAASKIGYRTLIVVLSKYVTKWGSDVTSVLDVKPKEIITIQGNKELKSLLWLSNEGAVDAKFIIISLNTIQNYYNEFKESGDDIVDLGYPYTPEVMCEKLGVGTVIFDEVHQHLYSVFRTLIHTHVHKVIALSATLISDDPFIDRMQNIMFPKEIRFDKVPMDRYIKVHAYSYSFTSYMASKKYRTTSRGSNTYSHIEFEKSLIKDRQALRSYLNMIANLVKLEYVNNYMQGDKLLIFAASIAMCTLITNRLKEAFPKYDIRRFVEDDPYENVIDPDIRVSTLLSSGTAIDIPNLRAAIMTNSVQSPVSNLQAMGRLRKLKDRDVTFSYLYNLHVPKQIDYHRRKKELFEDRVACLKEYKIEDPV